MGTWEWFLMIVAAVIALGTGLPLVFVRLRHRRGANSQEEPPLQLRICLGRSEPLKGFLLENTGLSRLEVSSTELTVDGLPVLATPSQLGPKALVAAGLQPERVRSCLVGRGTVIGPREKVWLISVDPGDIGDAEAQDYVAGLSRIGIRIDYGPPGGGDGVVPQQSVRLLATTGASRPGFPASRRTVPWPSEVRQGPLLASGVLNQA